MVKVINNKLKFDVVIIGSGIGGLVCGCYLRKAGFKVLIVEQQAKPGGYCSSFEREGFRFDVGVHYLGGINRGILGLVLRELNLKDKFMVSKLDPSDTIVTPDSITHIYKNPHETIQELIKNYPKEEKNIVSFFKLISSKSLSSLYLKIKDLTFKNLLNNFFENEGLKVSLSMLSANLGTHSNTVSATAMVAFYREFIFDPGYYPIGGMQSFADLLSESFKHDNGEIILKTKATKILTKNSIIYGVQLENGKKIRCKVVISNADASETFNVLLDTKLSESKMLTKLNPSLSVFAVYLGIIKENKNKTTIWHADSYDVDSFFPMRGEDFISKKFSLTMTTFPSSHDPTIKNSNQQTIQIFTIAPFESEEFWDRNKESFKLGLIKKLERVASLKKEHIKLCFTATPHTFERFTKNKNGAICGWESVANKNYLLSSPKTLINGLFLASHWSNVAIGGKGIPGVATVGRNVAIMAKLFLEKQNNNNI